MNWVQQNLFIVSQFSIEIISNLLFYMRIKIIFFRILKYFIYSFVCDMIINSIYKNTLQSCVNVEIKKYNIVCMCPEFYNKRYTMCRDLITRKKNKVI